jgi:hypothetical protein
VPRRVRMPAADELFRTTAGGAALLQSSRPEEPGDRVAGRIRTVQPATPLSQDRSDQSASAGMRKPSASVPSQSQSQPDDGDTASTAVQTRPEPTTRQRGQNGSGARRPSGRERHDEKITVYISPEELLGLEHARIALRGEYGVAVDRGRIVREAVAALLADLDARGPDSILVKRLSNGG